MNSNQAREEFTLKETSNSDCQASAIHVAQEGVTDCVTLIDDPTLFKKKKEKEKCSLQMDM